MNPILWNLINKHEKDIDANKFENLVYDSLSEGVFDEIIPIFKEADLSPNVFSEWTAITTTPRTFSIDTDSMPSRLKLTHFAVWTRRFNRLLSKIGLNEWDFSESTIHVKFSNKEETKNYGTISLDEAIDIVRKKWKLDETSEKILSQIRDIDTYHQEQQSSLLAEVIHASNREQSYDEIRQILDNLFGKVYFTGRILGEYRNSERTILLYTKNIELASAPDRTLEQSFELTFIHELFHAYHYRKNDRELRLRRDYTSDVIKESFAAAFEWDYCVEYKIAGDCDLRRDWEIHSVVAYPYSGAQHLIDWTDHKLQDTHFCTIFKESSYDMDGALRNLLILDFYNVKNVVLYREKEVVATDLRKAFDTLMKQDTIGKIAQREIPAIIRKNRLIIPMLLDLNYSKTHFHTTLYPILATKPMIDGSGVNRSYSKPVHIIGKTKYYLNSQWDKKQLDFLLDWIWANR